MYRLQDLRRNPRKTNELDSAAAQPLYRGRFAPSPTGPLHLGSLYTAAASFLEARSKQGNWLVRIDDLDTPRNIVGAADRILKTLEKFGLSWDETVFYQSEHLDTYHAFIEQLKDRQLVYPCSCSRKELTAFQTNHPLIYPGFCRDKKITPPQPFALRLKTEPIEVAFSDALQGLIAHNIATQHGDFVVKRKDQIIAYQFAVVIDDQQQRINHIVRGFDLLDCTPQQIYLQQLLDFATPDYTHVPILTDQFGHKLSKQTFAQAVDERNPNATLFYLLKLLKQEPPPELYDAPVMELLAWAIKNWQIGRLRKIRTHIV